MTMTMPTACQPAPITEAAAVLEARREDLADAERDARSARVGLDAARIEDRTAYAAARDRGEPDPGPKHLEAARQHLEDSERRLGGEQLRSQQAQDALDAVLEQHLGQWTDALDAELARADRASLKAVATLARTEAAREEIRAARAWIRRPSARKLTASPIHTGLKRNMNGDRFLLSELIAGVRDAIEDSTLSAEADRAAQREREQREVQELAAHR